MTQLPLFVPETSWKLPAMSALPNWREAKRVCVDVETRDESLGTLGIGVRRGGYVVGFGFTIEDGPSHYLPVRHQGGDNLDLKQVKRYLKAQAKAFKGEIVGAKLDYDLDYLSEEEIEYKNVKYFRDVQIAEPLIDELQDDYDLDSICARHGLPGKDEKMLLEAANVYLSKTEKKKKSFHKKGLWQLPGRFVGQYCEVDTQRPLQVLRRQERIIDDRNLWDIYNLESQVTPVLVRMRRRGILIDQDHLTKVEAWSFAEEAKALKLVKEETGYDIGIGNVWKADALAPALHAIGIKLDVTSIGKPHIDKDVLGEINHPVAKAIARARKVNKLRTTFAASIRKYMTNGRIHCSFNQMRAATEDGQDHKGARYGRLSCVHPNMQQQPARDEFAKMWRKIYIPEAGATWDCNDYSQQEPRWTTHFAGLINLPGGAEACQAYCDNPNLDNHDFMTRLIHGEAAANAMTPEEFKRARDVCKCIYLGLCYGEGGAKLCHDLNLPTRWALVIGRGRERRTEYFANKFDAYKAGREYPERYIYEAAGEEGQRILNTFDNRAPFIRKLAKEVSKTATKRGYIITIGGRHLHFPELGDGGYDWVHKALNRLIQGSSADQVKKAMVEVDAAGHYLQLQVHDELNSSVGEVKEAREISNIMQFVYPAKVPFRVDVEVGPSWGEVKKAA